ncbi:hypothetical protein A2U01_0067768, partial [Trifolium medium]|nr:hypothetical protein [Trifolium medium]
SSSLVSSFLVSLEDPVATVMFCFHLESEGSLRWFGFV